MFALATKKMSVALSRHVDLIRLGSPGVQVANNAHAEAASGRNAADGASSSGSGGGGGGAGAPRLISHHLQSAVSGKCYEQGGSPKF